MANMTFTFQGIDQLIADMEKLGKVPQGAVNQAARAGAKIAFKAAKANAPVGKTGNLKKGIILKAEKRTVMGKKSFQVTFDPSMTAIYRRSTQDGTRRRGGMGANANERIKGDYYYPASQEWGFQHPEAGYIPGYKYLKKAIDENKDAIEKAVLERLGKAIDKALKG